MKPADIITAINGAGARITSDGITITVHPRASVPPMVMDEARRCKPALVAELIERGRIHGPDGAEAAGLAFRLTRGHEMLSTLEAEGQSRTERYEAALALFERLLREYEGACERAWAEVAA